LKAALDILVSVLTYVIPVSAAAWIGHYFTARHYKKAKTYEFTERRLEELYGPLCSRLEQLRSDGNLKVAIYQAKDAAWKEKCARRGPTSDDHDKAFEPYAKSIDYENRHFREVVIPLYDEMLEILNEKRYLAYSSTLTFYDPFYRFVEVWHRWLDDAIPGEAVKRIEVREEELQPFYREIETRHAALVHKLSGDRSSRRHAQKAK
jgi:hypothetical protein